jgi:hypothetical protein
LSGSSAPDRLFKHALECRQGGDDFVKLSTRERREQKWLFVLQCVIGKMKESAAVVRPANNNSLLGGQQRGAHWRSEKNGDDIRQQTLYWMRDPSQKILRAFVLRRTQDLAR